MIKLIESFEGKLHFILHLVDLFAFAAMWNCVAQVSLGRALRRRSPPSPAKEVTNSCNALKKRALSAKPNSLTHRAPWLCLFQSIVTNDPDNVVQNADLTEWAEVFVILCAFANREEFRGLAEQLGARLELQAGVLRAESRDGSENKIADALELRRIATLTYLAAGRLERLVNIWIDELAEKERRGVKASDSPESTFTVFREAVKYLDGDLSVPTQGTDGAIKTYKLAALYDRYFEYSEMLAAQGLIKETVEYLKLTSTLDFATVRERLLVLSGEGLESRVHARILFPTAPARERQPLPFTSLRSLPSRRKVEHILLNNQIYTPMHPI